MSFFYNLNKTLANIAAKQDADQLNEGKKAKPDFLDVDKDGNEKESFKKALKDKGAEQELDEGALGAGIGAGLGALAGGPLGAVAGGALGKAVTDEDQEMTLEAVSRKHFQQVADLLRSIEDPEKRREMALHHAHIFKQQNPRFDQARFFQAAGLDEGSTGDYSAKKARAGKDIGKPGKNFAKIAKGAAERYGSKERGEKVAGAVLKKLRSKTEEDAELDESNITGTAFDTEFMKKRREKEATTGKYDVKDTGYSKRYTRREEPEADDEEVSDTPKKKGRPKGPAKGPERVTKGAWKHKGQRKVAEGDAEDNCCPHCGHSLVDEVAPPGKKAERMVKAIKKSLSKDGHLSGKDKAIAYATTWKAHKQGKVEEESTEAPAKAKAPKAKGGFQFGQGIYEGMNSKVESIINESISVNLSLDDQGKKSINVNATEQDAEMLAQLLKMAGLSGQAVPQEDPCACDQEMVDENSPDWPTNTETSDDALQYAGGLNKPKSTGQTTIPVLASQKRRQVSMEEGVELERSLFNTWKTYKGSNE